MSVTALPTSAVTVPVLGLGIRPRGPSTRPSRPTLPIMSGVATTASKSRKPPWIRSIRSSEPTKSAPAASASVARSPVANTRTRAVLPVPFGRFTVPRTIWSALRGSTPSRNATSTVGSNFVVDVFLARVTASAGVYRRAASMSSSALRYALLRFISALLVIRCGVIRRGGRGPRASAWPCHCSGGAGKRLVHDRDAHGAGRPGDDLLGRLHRGGVQVGHLHLGDVADLLGGDRAHLGLVRLAAALLHARRLLDQLRRRRRLRDEGERPVLVDGDLHGDDVAALRLGGRVVLLAEVHVVDAVRAERRADRRRRGGHSRVELDLDDRSDLLLPRSHVVFVPYVAVLACPLPAAAAQAASVRSC